MSFKREQTVPVNPAANALSLRILLTIFGLAVGLRLVNLAFLGDSLANRLIEDAPLYWNGAQFWIDSGWFSISHKGGYIPQTERMPIYFLFLIPFRWLFGPDVVPLLVAQAVLDAFTCVVIARLGAMVDRNTGIAAGILSAIWANMVIHASMVLTETLFLFLVSFLLLTAARYAQRGRFLDLCLLGVLCGVATATRSIALFIPVAMAALLPFITHRRGWGWRRGGAAASILLVLSALPASPILYRNMTQFDSFALTAQKGAYALYWVVGTTQSLSSGTSFGEVTTALNVKLARRLERETGLGHGLNDFQRSKLMVSIAAEEARSMPATDFLTAWTYGAAINLAAPALVLDQRIRSLKSASFANSEGDGLFGRLRAFLDSGSGLYVFWLGIGLAAGTVAMVLQVAGGLLLFRRMFWPAVFGTAWIVYFLLLNGPVGSPKYRIPFEPVLIVFQAVALVSLTAWINRRRAGHRKLD